ncbi:MAG: Npt1/Npt2 family nucleotide transporter [Caldilineaceae bacterium]
MKKLLVLTDLRALVDVRAHEVTLVGWVLLYTLCATTTELLVNTAAYALFLSTFDAQRLPYIYIGISIASVLITTLYLQLSQRYSLAQMLFGMHLLLLLTLIGYRAGLGMTGARWLLFSLPIWHGVINILLYMAFWNLVGRLFNLQQGKRLFGLFGAGQQVANLGVGILIPTLVAWVGAANLLFVAICAGGGALYFLLIIARHFAGLHRQEQNAPEVEGEVAPPSEGLLRDPYVRLIFALFILFALGSYFVDNIFYNRLESRYPNEDQLASFLGLFNGVLGGVSLLSQLFVANRLLRHYGVRAMVILTPLLLLIPTVLFALIGGLLGLMPVHFWLAVSMNLMMQVMNDSDNTAANLLYQPLPITLRTRIQTVADGIVSPTAVGLTGLLLLILTNVLHYDALQLGYVLLPILVGWAWAGRLLGRGYGERVQQALRQRALQGKQFFQPDRVGREIIQQALADPHPGAVLYAMDLLRATNQDELAHALPGLLTHPSADVRLAALAQLEGLDVPTTLPAIYECWQHDPNDQVRCAALQAIATLGDADDIDQLYDILTAPDLPMRRSVMIGFLRSGALAAILTAGERLTHLINSPAPADRILAAQILGESGVAGFYRPLLTLANDPALAVQRAALQAAGKLQHPKLWPTLLAALATPPTRATARAALMASGEALLPTLQTLLTAGEETDLQSPLYAPQVQRELIYICSRVSHRTRHPQAVTLLRSNLMHPDQQVRTRVLQALAQGGYETDPENRLIIEAEIQSEFALAAWTVAGLVDLAEANTSMGTGNELIELVCSALAESLRQQRLRLYWWFILLYDRPTLLRVRDAFVGAQEPHRRLPPEQRAYLLETIDLFIAKRYTRLLLPLLDELTPAQQQARLAAEFPQPTLPCPQRLQAIITNDTPWLSAWLRAVALYTSAHIGAEEEQQAALLAAACALATAPDGLLQETAAWVWPRLAVKDDHARIARTEVENSVNPITTGDKTMLLTIEKVIILRTVDIFADTPDEILGEVASLLKEIEAPAGATIITQGEQGDSMYIIVEGEVEVLDGDQVFTKLGERQVFGEMALLDGEPRTATIRTTQATRLLRLDQEPFYELMDDRIEIVRGIIHVLLQRLRARTSDVNRLQAQLKALS